MTRSALYRGIGISGGKAQGKIKFYKEANRAAVKGTRVVKEIELKRLKSAKEKSLEQIKELLKIARTTVGEGEAEIFEIHAMLIEDEDMASAMEEEIYKGKSAEAAVEASAEAYSEMLKSLNDEYLSGRAADIKDICARILRNLVGHEGEKEEQSEPYILVAEDLTPSQTVSLDRSKILGFVTFGGTPSSHTAILARAMGIPALIGTGEISEKHDGSTALLNAQDGTLTVNPTPKEVAEFEIQRRAQDKISKEHERYLRSVMNKPAVTQSGHRMLIYANVGDEGEVAASLSNGAEGIGLLRSEFMYLSRKEYPTEEELFRAYKSIALEMGGRRVIVRTLDVGADKQIPYFSMPHEENPALGYRAIRLCLDRQELFKVQLRAILRASALGNVCVMLPMVVSVDEVLESKKLLEECKRELLTQGRDFDSKIQLGIMIETPAAAIMSRELAREVDFFSVGTNDLSQYTLAADRQNPALSRLCEENTEPVLRLIKMAADSIHDFGGWIGICGEMAADLSLTQRFADMGIDELSVSAPYLLGVRGKVGECS